MIALAIVAVILATVLHCAAHLNRPRNVAAGFTLGERSTLLGSALILAAYGCWAVLVTVFEPGSLSPTLAFGALVVLDGAAFAGAKSAWIWLDRRAAAEQAALDNLPRRWRGMRREAHDEQ